MTSRLCAYLTLLTCLTFSPALAKEPSFSGDWEATYGPLHLEQKGDRVSGYYMFQGARCTVDGKLTGRRLEFTYQEPSASGEGWFELSEDGKTFQGMWRQHGTTAWARWKGRRATVRPGGPDFSGLWDSSFGRMRLQQKGKQVEGVYAYTSTSSIRGTIKGRRLKFRYSEPDVSGTGIFDLSADGLSIQGKWKPDGKNQWGKWEAHRAQPRPGLIWLVVIEYPWEQGLEQHEYSFGQMLKAFFARTPHVQVRQRFFSNPASLIKWTREISFLAEPVVLAISTHGTDEGIKAGNQIIGPAKIAEALRYASSLKLIHFSSCQIMKGDLAKKLKANLQIQVPISGYSHSVDWATSAVLEFMYFDLVLARRLDPEEAAGQIRLMMPIAGRNPVENLHLPPAGFEILP